MLTLNRLCGSGAQSIISASQMIMLGEAETVKLAWKPNLTVDMDEKDAGTLLKLIDTLDDDDDVQTVWGNYDISDEVMEKVG